MIPIYICEDDREHQKNMEYIINRKIMADDLDMEIKLSTNNPEKIIDATSKNREIGIYFLDIELSNEALNGLTLATQIRQFDPDGYIIFVTTHSEMSYLTFQYKVGALDFIIKEELKKMTFQVEECIDVIEKRLKSKRELCHDLFVIEDGELASHLRFDDIYCFEALENHRVIVISKQQEIIFSSTLKKVEEQLDARFFRSHRSCLVNVKNIISIDKEKRLIHFDNNITSNISKLKVNELKKKIKR